MAGFSASGDDGLTRRDVLAGAGAAAAALLAAGLGVRYIANRPDATPTPTPVGPAGPFALGVASGDPLPDSVILWTRLAEDGRGTLPQGLFYGGGPGTEVQWQVSRDEAFTQLVASGSQRAESSTGYSIHADVRGLQPGGEYFYRFRVFGDISPVGRTRTLPPPRADVSSLRFAFSSCQNYADGYYPSHRALAEEDLAFVAWLGDYIYETESEATSARLHSPTEAGSGLLRTLQDYRDRYAQYHSDLELQAAHAAHPWVVTWDDHEVRDNYAGAFPGPAGDYYEQVVERPEDVLLAETQFLELRARAYQAWWENIPTRAAAPTDGGELRIYRDFDVGTLMRVCVLDGRQYREHPAAEGRVAGLPQAGETNVDGSMTGQAQEEWLLERLASSPGRWNVIAQPVVMMPVHIGPVVNLDQWDGFGPQRERLLRALREFSNPVVLSGDVHTTWMNVLSYDAETDASVAATKVASELVAPSTSSEPPFGYVAAVTASNLVTNPGMRYFQGENRGYMRCEVTRDALRATPVFAESVASPDEPVGDGPTFVITAGDPEIRPA